MESEEYSVAAEKKAGRSAVYNALTLITGKYSNRIDRLAKHMDLGRQYDPILPIFHKPAVRRIRSGGGW